MISLVWTIEINWNVFVLCQFSFVADSNKGHKWTKSHFSLHCAVFIELHSIRLRIYCISPFKHHYMMIWYWLLYRFVSFYFLPFCYVCFRALKNQNKKEILYQLIRFCNRFIWPFVIFVQEYNIQETILFMLKAQKSQFYWTYYFIIPLYCVIYHFLFKKRNKGQTEQEISWINY